MSSLKIFFAGSGGQGVLMMGEIVTYAAMYQEKEATFLPSYGPEMRGGTANCTVIVSDTPISCPLIYESDVVVAMNKPSVLKFESLLKPGGVMFINSSLADLEPTRKDITVYKVPANEIAEKMGNSRAANMVMVGEVVRRTGVVSIEQGLKVVDKFFGSKKASILELNKKAFKGEY